MYYPSSIFDTRCGGAAPTTPWNNRSVKKAAKNFFLTPRLVFHQTKATILGDDEIS